MLQPNVSISTLAMFGIAAVCISLAVLGEGRMSTFSTVGVGWGKSDGRRVVIICGV